MSFIDELNQVIYDLPFNKNLARRNKVAHFCEHDGICISFTRARTTWHAMAPCALKPWWLFLEPQKKDSSARKTNTGTEYNKQEKNNKNIKAELEVTENA